MRRHVNINVCVKSRQHAGLKRVYVCVQELKAHIDMHGMDAHALHHIHATLRGPKFGTYSDGGF